MNGRAYTRMGQWKITIGTCGKCSPSLPPRRSTMRSSNKGVPSALISLPLRYMHTTVEMVHKQDVEDCIRLIYDTLLNIQPGEDFKYL